MRTIITDECKKLCFVQCIYGLLSDAPLQNTGQAQNKLHCYSSTGFKRFLIRDCQYKHQTEFQHSLIQESLASKHV